jgi:hypothetical protein
MDCTNMGGLVGHVVNTKDLDHEEFRRENTDLRAALRGDPTPEDTPTELGTDDPSEPEASVGEDPAEETGDGQRRDVQIRPPEVVEPLMDPETGDDEGSNEGSSEPEAGEEGGEDDARGSSAAERGVPEWAQPGSEDTAIQQGQIEPFIAGGVAQAANGLYLTEEADGEISRQEVGDSGFPAAVERALVYYYPDVSWDHPGMVVFVSAMGLATAIQAKKGQGPATPEAVDDEGSSESSPESEAQPEAQQTDLPAEGIWAEVASGEAQEDAQDLEEPEGSGSDYWQGIQRQAGGGSV